jgi:hypothetical protein
MADIRPIDEAQAVQPVSSIRMSTADSNAFGQRPIVASHDLHRSELFTDAALIALLDAFPRQQLHALTMGGDPQHPEENQLALHDGVCGADLLRAVYRGRLWLNITRVDTVDRRYRSLVDELYERISTYVPGFLPQSTQATLLVSSPDAIVYYHVDGPASVLWHIRGRKRIWVYPCGDSRYVERETLEDIFAGARHEYLPYHSRFDDAATVYDLEPGQWISWAQNAPHRVTNLAGVNVSLSTEHFTGQTRRRAQIYSANRFLRTRLGMRRPSTREDGAVALLKTVTHGLVRRIGLSPTPAKRHTPTMRVDPSAPRGVVPLTGDADEGDRRSPARGPAAS